MKLYLHWHTHKLNDDYGSHDEEKLIGIYSTEEKAADAIETYKDLEGSRDYLVKCFEIHEAVVERLTWNEGFTTVCTNSRTNTFATEENRNVINQRVFRFHIGSTFRAR